MKKIYRFRDERISLSNNFLALYSTYSVWQMGLKINFCLLMIFQERLDFLYLFHVNVFKVTFDIFHRVVILIIPTVEVNS